MTSNELADLKAEVARLSTELDALRNGSGRDRRRSRRLLTAGLVTCLALGTIGGAQALPGKNTVDSGDIINGQVKTKDLGANAVKSPKVADNSLTGSDIAESSLNFADTTCSLEQIHSFARVKTGAGMPDTFTTSGTWVDVTHNCSGGTVEVKRSGTGNYWVRFNGDPAALASVTAMPNGPDATEHTVAVYPASADGFRVIIRNSAGDLSDTAFFNIVSW